MNIQLGLYTAMRAMQADSLAIDTTSHNIANMNTPGYSEQITNLTAAQPMSNTDGAGQVGTGSTVSSLDRIRDIYLDTQIDTENSDYNKWLSENTVFQSLAAIFPEIGSSTPSQVGITKAISDFTTSEAALASGATGSSAADVYSKAQALATLLNQSANQINNLQTQVNSGISDAVTQANTYLQQIAYLNKEIVNVSATGQQPNDLMDQRTQAMLNLSAIMNFNVANAADGSVVIMANNQALVQGSNASRLVSFVGASGTMKDVNLENVGVITASGSTPQDITSSITSGQIGGLLAMRDAQLPFYRQQLDDVASSLITVTNKIQEAVGSTATTEGMDFFTGTRATDIAVNSALLTGTAIQSTASLLSNVGNLLMSTSVESSNAMQNSANVGILSTDTLGSIVNTANNGQIAGAGTIIINGTSIAYTPNETVAQLASDINSHSGLTAVYDNFQNAFKIFVGSDVTVQENNTTVDQSLMNALQLTEKQISSAPVNNPQSSAGAAVSSGQTWIAEKNLLDVNPVSPQAPQTGIVDINYQGADYKVIWNTTDVISTTVVTELAHGSGVLNQFSYDPVTQKFLFGTTPNAVGTATMLSPFVMSDEAGNVTQVMKMTGSQNFTDFYTSVTTSLKGQMDSSATLMNQYKAGLDQTQAIQTNITKVDPNAELAKAKLYQRAYDASVRLSEVIDEMLNMLINHMGTSSSDTQSA